MALRTVASGSGQGSIFSRLLDHIEAIRLPGVAQARIRGSALRSLLEVMRQHDSIHRHARSVHSCALFQDARLLVSVEDVSRHNALDTISGWMALHGIEGGDKVLFTTGRLTGEMVIKAAQSGVPILVSRNGVSAMGYDLAKKFGMALFGRAVNRRFHCYVGEERLRPLIDCTRARLGQCQHMLRRSYCWTLARHATFPAVFLLVEHSSQAAVAPPSIHSTRFQ